MTRTPKLNTSVLPDYLLPVALYARLSVNADGTKDSVATQQLNGHDYCGNRWPGRAVIDYSDDGISASNEDTYRPGFELMLVHIAEGKIGDVVARWQARISRSQETWPRFKKVCLKAGIDTLHTWLEGDIALDPAKSLGGDVGNLMNARQSALTTAAVHDTLNRRAKQGRPSGGRPYGYTHGRNGAGESVLVVVPEQAAIIEDMARMILSGYSLTDVARRLNERGVPTARGGKEWEPSAVRKIVTKPAIAGWRTHNGEITAPGTWTKILSDDMWRAVRHQLDSPRKVTRSDGVVVTRKPGRRKARRYLLSCGIMVCGRCGAEMIAQLRTGRHDSKTPMYLCSSHNGGCNGLSIFAEKTEEYVERIVKVYLSDRTEVAKLMAIADEAAAKREKLELERDAIEQRRDEAAEKVADGEITIKMAQSIDRKCEKALVKLEAKIDALIVPDGVVDYRTVGMSWDDLLLAEKRATMFDLQCSVEILPAFGSRAFNPDRISVSFKGVGWSLSGKGHRPSAAA